MVINSQEKETHVQVQVGQISVKIGLCFQLEISSGIFGMSLMPRADERDCSVRIFLKIFVFNFEKCLICG